MSEYHFTDCKWLPANHFLFQMANVCLVASYFAPDSLNGLFMLRASLGFGGLFFSLWGWWVLCAPDTFVWNLLFMVFNFGHLAFMVYKIKKPRRFSCEAESVYKHLFEPLGVERYQFQKIANLSTVIKLSPNELYGKEGTPADRISVLLRGKVEAIKGEKLLHTIREYEFVDSPEWATFRAGEVPRFGVTLAAVEESTFLSWDCCDLRQKLKSDPLIKNVFNSLIGQDVTIKLLNLDHTYEASSTHDDKVSVYEKHENISGYLNAFKQSLPRISSIVDADSQTTQMEKMPLLNVTTRTGNTRNGMAADREESV